MDKHTWKAVLPQSSLLFASSFSSPSILTWDPEQEELQELSREPHVQKCELRVLVSQSKTRAELLSQTCKGRSSLGNNMQIPWWGQQCAQSPRGSKERENVWRNIWKKDLQLHYRWNSCFARVKSTQLNVSFHFPSWFYSFLELLNSCYCRSVTKWCLTMQPHELQQAGLPCPSQSPGACLDSCLLVNYAIQPSVNSLSSCPQSFPASGSFPISWLFASGGQGSRA